MFFYIGEVSPLTALTKVENNLYLDKGWEELNGIWYKGYSTDCVLKDAVHDILKGYQPRGKWCVIHQGTIYHPELRGFPVYRKNNDLTNLLLDGYAVEIYPDPKYNPSTNLSLEEASELIGDILHENTVNFYKYNDVGHAILVASAGLDTTTCWALVDQVTHDYTIFSPIPYGTEKTVLEYTGSVREYESDLIDKVGKDYWGYLHPSFYNEKTYMIAGYDAEMIQYRDAEAINAIANYQGKYIDEVAEESDYLYHFLKRPGLSRYEESMLTFNSEEQLKDYLFRTVFYDCQMWHLDNTIFFSPFYDIRIPNIMAGLSVSDLTKNAVTGQVQVNVIKRFKPDLLSILADYKNEGQTWKNFQENFVNLKLDPKTKIDIRNFSSLRQKSS